MADSVIQGVVGKLVEYSADAIKKQVSYLCCYSCNVQTLADEVGELNIKRQSLQLRVDADRANSRIILQEVEAWLSKVEDLKTRSNKICSDAEEEVKRNFLCKWFPVLHYSLSRTALKTTNDSVQLRNIEFPIISTSGIPVDIPSVPSTSNIGFKSRVSIEDGIVDALKDSSVYSIGIWGIGGVGKTVMAKQIEKRVRDEKYFERVVMVVVSQQPDLPKIQSQITRELGLICSENSFESRSKKLHHRLMAEKEILIILDDLWEMLDLEKFGIHSQRDHARCKLILTSRDRDALTSSGVPVQNIFQLEILTKEESWRFFKDIAGINADDDSHDELVQIAKKVERECMGLPLALKIVARALKGKGIFFWNNAVQELQKHIPDNIPGITKGVYGSLLFSIKALEGKEQKYLFLFCCLFPEDYCISTEELLRCVMGLRIFKELENLTEARDKVETVLNILLFRSLLMEGDEKHDNFNVRMHDIIRDVGIWIATKEIEKHVFLIKHGVNEWPTVEDDNYTCISLLFSHRRIIFPESIVFPKLEFLRLDFVRRFSEDYYVELSENFFNGMSGLRFFEAIYIGLLPPSMCPLNNLRTLSLKYCKIFESTSVLGKLTNLEMLSLIDCMFEVLPAEIGGLKKLKQMDISECRSLKRIAFGVVSGLTKLEELVIWNSFSNWEAKGEGEEDVACLSELNGLKNLTTLKIEIRNPSVVPKQKPLWVQKLKKYGITVSNCSYEFGTRRFQKAILLGKEVVNPLEDWIYSMANDAEYVNLESCNCMKFVKGLSENSRNRSCLKQLRLSHFTSIQYLVKGQQNSAIFNALESLCIEDSTTLQQNFEVSPQTGTFEALQRIYLNKLSGLVCLWKFSIKEQLYLRNLQKVEIDKCDNLSYLFSLSVVQSLVHLTSLVVRNCRMIKEIFKKENGELEEINEIKLPRLRKINFGHLDSFCGLCIEIDRIELPELHELNIYDLPRMKMAEGDNNEVYQKYLVSKVDNVQIMGIRFNFCVLRNLEVNGIENFKCMFSPSVIIRGLPNLEYLNVSDCSMLEDAIGKDNENVGRAIIFPNLIRLWLRNLPNIRTFCYNAIQFPSLYWLRVHGCSLMLKFVEGLTDDISSSRPFLDKQVQCPKLEHLDLHNLNISGVFSPPFFKSPTILKILELRDCKELEHVITKEEGPTTTNIGEDFIQKIPLKFLNLFNMPKLHGSIFQIKHNLEFPSLEEIEIKDCPMLEKFSLGSVYLPKLIFVSGLPSTKSVAKFFSNKEMVSRENSKNNCFIISPKDISFSSNREWHFCVSKFSESFVEAVSIALNNWAKEIVGKFNIEKIRTRIEYEVMLMIMLLERYVWKDQIEIELKLHKESKLQHTVILENHPNDTWIEISIGKFVGELSQQNEQLEFSLRQSRNNLWHRTLIIGGIRIVEV